MKTFIEIVEALKAGHQVRNVRWEAATKAYVSDNIFYIQRGEREPYPYDLSWRELNEKKWRVV